MTAASAYWPESKRLEGLAVFPSSPDLKARGIADGVSDLYLRMAERNELFVCGGQAIDPVAFVELVVERFGPRFAAICGDFYRKADLLDALRAAQVPVCPINFRRFGWLDGSEDVLHFQRACLGGRVVPAAVLGNAGRHGRGHVDFRPRRKRASSAKTAQKEASCLKRSRDDLAAASIYGSQRSGAARKSRTGNRCG